MNFRANIPWLAHSKPNALNAKRGADALRTLTFGAAVFISATAATAQDVQFFPFCPPGEGMSRAFGASPDCAVTVGEYIITMVVDNGTIVDVFDCAVAPDLPGCECPPCGNPFCECFCPLGISYSYLFNGFRWSGGTLLRLPPLDSETFNPWQLVSRANATSQGGTISVGRSRNISPSSVSSTQATAWDSAGNPISLGYHDVAPPTDLIVSYHSNAADVSADGTIIVGSSDFDEGEQCVPCPPNPAQVAMKWTLSGGSWVRTTLPSLGGQNIPTKALGISADGAVISGQSGLTAVIWTSSGIQALPHLSGGFASEARAVANPVGGPISAAGYSQTSLGSRAVRWYQNTSGGWNVEEIDFTDVLLSVCDPKKGEPSTPNSEANDISADGHVIVGWVEMLDAGCFRRGFAWDSTNGARVLRDVVNGLEAYDDEMAHGISAEGQVIVGESQLDFPIAWRTPACGPCDQGPCPADIVENDVVDVNDLLAVISHYGPCPCCADNCVGNTNCDFVVDVNDLLAVISAWGNCPP